MLQTDIRSRLTPRLGSDRSASRFRLSLLAVLLGCVVLVGCGDSDGDDGGSGSGSGNPPTSSSPPPSNPPPSSGSLALNGSPSSSVLVGSSYNFVPTTSNANGETLTFSVSNKPGWAEFNSSTGRLSGTPGPGDVGSYGNIVISVSDGSGTASTDSFSIAVVATANGSATLTWQPPTEREDGTPLLSNLAGYKVYWGTSPSNLEHVRTIDNPGITSFLVEELTPSTWFFAVTAYDSSGLESSKSNTASKAVF
jgi:hypothetical protein